VYIAVARVRLFEAEGALYGFYYRPAATRFIKMARHLQTEHRPFRSISGARKAEARRATRVFASKNIAPKRYRSCPMSMFSFFFPAPPPLPSPPLPEGELQVVTTVRGTSVQIENGIPRYHSLVEACTRARLRQ